MEKNTILTGAALLVVGLFIGYAFGNQGAATRGGHMMPNGSMMAQNIDQHFIAEMIPHHEGAIAMARVALERSKRPEIRSLSNGIIEAQQKEIDDMRGWYQSWYGTTPPAGGMGGMRPSDERGSTEANRPNVHMGGMEGALDLLESVSSSEFDREFMVQMIPHHEMAIMMAGMLEASTERPEMKQLADNILTSQSREIEMMRSWLAAWY